METRGFVIARHPTLGLLLLKGRAKKKKGKPAHFQLPGGKVNGGETAVVAAARELWEETGVDVRLELSRLEQLKINGKMHLKGRSYFALALNDGDTVSGGTQVGAGTTASALAAAAHNAGGGAPFAIKLSAEHTAAVFEVECSAAVKTVELHSGGKNSQALAVLGCCEAASFWTASAAAAPSSVGEGGGGGRAFGVG